jgi:hypothetical protein
MNKKKYFLIIFIFFAVVITIINVFANSSMKEKNKRTEKYFTNLDLKVRGTICSIEEQTDTHKYLITLKNIKSNKKNYKKNSPLGPYFCITKGDLAVFAEHYDNYQIGDSIIIGENKTDLVKCISTDGNIKFIKKRKEALLYDIAWPNERMKKLIENGCK